jgi:hypothetical protein
MKESSQEFTHHYENIKRVSYAAIIDRCLAHPIDNFITAHQHDNGKLIPVAKKMLQGGRKHIYAGFIGSLVSAIPVRVATYSTFFVAHDHFKRKGAPLLTSSIKASLLSAITESFAIFPSDINRTRKLLNSQGGLSFSIILKSYSMLLSRLMVENTIGLSGADLSISSINISKDSRFLTFTLALVAGMASQALPAPFDWLKTKYMDGKKINPKQELINLMKYGFVRHVGLRSLRAGICNAIIFSVVGDTFARTEETNRMVNKN